MAASNVELHAGDGDLLVDEQAVWLYTNRNFGNVVPSPGLDPSWKVNRPRALRLLGQFSAANQVMRMRRTVTEYEDLSKVQPKGPETIYRTDAIFTTNPEHILNAHPADCEEVGLAGMSRSEGVPVAGLVHAGRRIVVAGGHLRAIEYLLNTYDVDPAELSARMSPSVRAASYKFPLIDEAQRLSPRWADYISEQPDGIHVDVHRRVVDDLQQEFGILPENMNISPIDTGIDPAHYSHVHAQTDSKFDGYNGLFFALRGDVAEA